MADYKRMVSYMYQYENGVKKKNVGFARVEAKNGQCKITLHMQLLGQLDSIFPTYLIQRDETNMDLIYLGDTLLRNQIMDSKLAANEENIMDSGYGLSAMGGLLLFLNDNVFFATEWDDKPIVAKEVLAALQPKAKKKVPIVEENEIREAPVVEKLELDKEGKQLTSTVAKEELQQTSTVAKEELQQTEVSPVNSIDEELLIPKYKLPRGWKTIERFQKPYVESMNKTTEQVKSIETFEQIETLEQSESMETIELFGQSEPMETMEITKSSEPAEQIVSAEAVVLTMVEEQKLSSSESDLPDHPSALHFFNNYPRIYPFEDNEISLCVKIEPKDIGSLPKDIWALSNNSFLMHGFYCYHHLIFAKITDRFGCRYLLGIPGIYHNRERFMARMFGFESFKSIRRRELRQGDFGYWYLPITF